MDYEKYYKYTFKIGDINLNNKCIASRIYKKSEYLGYMIVSICADYFYLDLKERRNFQLNIFN